MQHTTESPAQDMPEIFTQRYRQQGARREQVGRADADRVQENIEYKASSPIAWFEGFWGLTITNEI